MNISDEIKELYKKDGIDSVHKGIVLTFPECNITNISNDRIYAESMVLTESIVDGQTLEFGTCNASKFEIQVADVVDDLKGQKLHIIQRIDGYSISFFTGYVDSVERQANRRYKKIVAYDLMYSIMDKDVSNWYNSVVFPIACRNLRDSLFKYLKIAQIDTKLCNDHVLLQETIKPSELKARDVAKAICQINGAFGHIDEVENFEYITLCENGLYPSENLYPSDDLYPRNDGELFDGASYIKCDYSDYEVKPIDKLQIRQDKDDIGVVCGDGNNTYIIENNFLLYGMSSTALKQVGTNLLPQIANRMYRPQKTNLKGLPYMRVGDLFRVITRDDCVESYIFKRTLKGLQALRDTYESNGVEEHEEKVLNLNTAIEQLKGKTNSLVRTAEETISKLTDLEKSTESKISQSAEEIKSEVTRAKKEEEKLASSITQNAEKIELKVEKGSVSSQLSIESSGVHIEGNRFSVNTDNFELTKTGTITSKQINGENKVILENGLFSIYNGYMHTGDIGYAEDAISHEMGAAIVSKKDFVALGVGTIYKYVLRNNVGYSEHRHNFFDSSWFEGEVTVGGNLKVPNTIIFPSANNARFIAVNGNSVGINSGFWIDGDLNVAGTKNRIVKTNNHGVVAMSAYETASPMFADIGHGVLSENGVCHVEIDSVFLETIDTSNDYYVFLSRCGEGDIFCERKENNFFVVKGTPSLKFDWNITAAQKGYSENRMKQIKYN